MAQHRRHLNYSIRTVRLIVKTIVIGFLFADVRIIPIHINTGAFQYQAFFNRQTPGAYRIVPTSNDPSVECIILVKVYEIDFIQIEYIP